ncbi:hypothetical protein [Kutzneria chonburiensis]|uniref:hypothetical protein n=1 Tax=Kutzneria chonburiensis TaxID=1483604 RepID=UPI00308189BE
MTRDNLDGRTRDDLLRAGLEEDGVRLVRYADRWPLPGTRAERRAVRGVMGWLGLSALLGVACIVLYLVWPFRYPAAGYELYTPLLGLTGGGCVLLLAVAIIRYSKNFLPEEQAVQERHDDPSGEFDRTTTSALVTDTVRRGGMPRRRMVLGMAGVGVGIPVVGAVIAAVGGLIKDPGGSRRPTRCGTAAGTPRTARRCSCARTSATRTRSCWYGRRTWKPGLC